MESGNDVRLPTVSGTFYTDDKKELIKQLGKFFCYTKRIITDKKIKALIVPHAGYKYCGLTASWGYKQLPQNIDTNHFVLIGPSHHYHFEGLAASECKAWQTPLGLVQHISPTPITNKGISIDNQSHSTEHSLEVQLPFLQYLYKDFSITSFLTGNTFNFENAADYFINNYSNSIHIISSDLSHYLPCDTARETDKKTINAILRSDSNLLMSEDNIACGIIGINILITIAKKKKWKSKLVYYDTSATASKDTSAVVGYTAICFYE